MPDSFKFFWSLGFILCWIGLIPLIVGLTHLNNHKYRKSWTKANLGMYLITIVISVIPLLNFGFGVVACFFILCDYIPYLYDKLIPKWFIKMWKYRPFERKR